MHDKIIFIFSKDRPDRLKITLPKVANLSYRVVLIDDSSKQENQMIVRKLCNSFGIIYHGLHEQLNFINKNGFADQKFTARLGSSEWALGGNRNYVLLLGCGFGSENIIMMDDDVVVDDIFLIENIFGRLNKERFVGSNINNMPDDSVVGHIYRSGGIVQTRYVSGTFLGINLREVGHFFVNIYNEDWIWLFLENNGKKVKIEGNVDQLLFDPFDNGIQKSMFQEFGEICWEGVLHSDVDSRKTCLTSKSHWNGIIEKRINDINNISELTIPYYLKHYAYRVQDSLLSLIKTFHPEQFSLFFKEYYDSLEIWNKLIRAYR